MKNRISRFNIYSKEAGSGEIRVKGSRHSWVSTQKPASKKKKKKETSFSFFFFPYQQTSDFVSVSSPPPGDSEKVDRIPGSESQILSGLNYHCFPFLLESQWISGKSCFDLTKTLEEKSFLNGQESGAVTATLGFLQVLGTC